MNRGLRAGLLAGILTFLIPASAAAFGPLSSFGSFGEGAGQLSSPAQIAVAGNGDLYVADSGNDRISVFAGDGSFLRALAGQMLEPKDVALEQAGRVFVADYGNNRIDVLSTAGAFLFAFGEAGAGELSGPTGVVVGGSAIYVADSGNTRIAIFEDGGEFLDSFPTATPPKDVIVGPDGNLYVVVDKRIEVFTAGGEFVRSFGDEGSEKLDKPVALATAGNEILVADQVAEKIERFDADGDFLGGFAAEPNVAGVGVACQGNVFAVEEDAFFARVERFGETGTPPPPCALPPPGEPIEVSLVRVPSNKFRFAGLIKNRRNGSAVLFVRVPGPGRVILHGRGFRRLARGARRAGLVRLPVKPKVRLKHFLKQHGKGRIRLEVTFKPLGGVPLTREKVLVLRRKRR